MTKLKDSSKTSTTGAARSSLAADFPETVIDQTAETKGEMAAQWPKGLSSLEDFIRAKVAAGEWERVWKRDNGRLKPAYRRSVK